MIEANLEFGTNASENGNSLRKLLIIDMFHHALEFAHNQIIDFYVYKKHNSESCAFEEKWALINIQIKTTLIWKGFVAFCPIVSFSSGTVSNWNYCKLLTFISITLFSFQISPVQSFRQRHFLAIRRRRTTVCHFYHLISNWACVVVGVSRISASLHWVFLSPAIVV